MSWGNGLCPGRGVWRQGVRFGEVGSHFTGTPIWMELLPTEGGKASSSPRNLRPEGGRNPSHRNHYSQLQLWQPSSPGGALICSPKATCPFPQSPPETASHHQVERLSERLSLCSPTQGRAHQCPPQPPRTDVLVWFDSQELIHPFWLHFSLSVGAAWSSSSLSWQHRAGGPFLEGGKAWKTHVLSLFSHVGMDFYLL